MKSITGSGGLVAPRRQARSLRNDARILDAALDLADRLGWRGLAVAHVAEVAGLSRPTVQSRFEDRPAIAEGLWSMLVVEPLRGALERVARACTQDGSLTAQTLWSVLEPFAHPTRELRVAAELLIVGRYEPTVGAAIASTLVPELERWLDPSVRNDGVQAAIRAFACNLALGLLVEVRRHPAEGVDFSVEMANMAAAFNNPATPTALPTTTAFHLDRVANFDTGDDDVNHLLRATLEHVAHHGYEATTIARIAATSARRTSGFIFSRYASKRDLFLDANRRYTEVASSLNEAFIQSVTAASSAGLAEAVTTRELMRPERRTVMNLSLEVYRLSWHDPEVVHAVDVGYEDIIRHYAAQQPEMTSAQHRAWLLMELARGNGPLVLAGLSDTAWMLPYDVVTVPLIDGTGPAS